MKPNPSPLCTEVPRSWTLVDSHLRNIMDHIAHQGTEWPLLLFGPPGTGKTCAALALTDLVPGSRVYWEFSDASRAWSQAGENRFFRDCGHADSVRVSQQTLEREWSRAEMAVIDDLPAKPSDSRRELLMRLLNRRGRRPLVVITNTHPRELVQPWGHSIVSRLFCGRVHELNGPDRRMERPAEPVDAACAASSAAAE